MAKKSQKSPFGHPFNEWRTSWINEGDRLIAEAEELLDDPTTTPHKSSHRSRYGRAARLYAKSARFYRQAGLGLMAQASYQDAAECCSVLGDEQGCREYEGKANEIPEYWSE